MLFKLCLTGLGSGIDQDRADYTVYSGECSRPHLRNPWRSRQSALVLVANRQRSDVRIAWRPCCRAIEEVRPAAAER